MQNTEQFAQTIAQSLLGAEADRPARPLIAMRGIRKSYYIGQPNELEILHGIDLTVYPGEFVAIVGESGSGKSTLMNIIGVLDKPTAGEYVLDGVNAALQAERSCVFPGEPCPLRVTLDNPKWLPLVWLTVRFPLEPGGALRPEHRWETVELPEGGVQKPYYEKNVSFLLGHQWMSYTSRLQAEHRGLLSFDRIRLLSGDGLCLCVREKEIPLPRPVTLAVFPRLVPVSTRWFLRNSWELETGARGFQDDRTVIRNVRAYQPGDNARSLNFRLMARGQGAMVNIYEKISPRRAAFLLDGASFAGLPPEDFESALEILGSLAAQLMEEEVAVSLLISRPAGRLEQFATCRDRRQLPAVLTLLAAADTAVSITADEILPRLRTLSGAFLICGDVRRLDAGTCALLERHRVPLLAWGEQSHPLLRVLDLNAFRAGGGL